MNMYSDSDLSLYAWVYVVLDELRMRTKDPRGAAGTRVRKRECCKRRTSTYDLRRYVFKTRDAFSFYSYRTMTKQAIFVFVHVWQDFNMMQPVC